MLVIYFFHLRVERTLYKFMTHDIRENLLSILIDGFDYKACPVNTKDSLFRCRTDIAEWSSVVKRTSE